MKEWYIIDNDREVDTPSLIIYPERVKENIRILKQFVPDVNRLRPHIKTNKSPDVCRMMMDAGIYKFKCATIAEAEMLASMGAKDVLLAHQPVGPKVARVFQLIREYPGTKFSCIFDCMPVAQELSVAGELGTRINIYMDLNVGMNRTGIIPAHALQLFKDCQSLKGISVVGLHVYDGHLRDSDFQKRKAQCDEAFAPVWVLRAEIEKLSSKPCLVVAGGTPSFTMHATNSTVECSPGTFIFWDKGYQTILPEQPFLFSALVLSRVVSKPDEKTICVDLGHKSIASENPLPNRVYFLNAPDFFPVSHSEEHLVLKTTQPHDFNVGDLLYGVPHHICPTVALHDEAIVIADHRVKTIWPITSRKRKITV